MTAAVKKSTLADYLELERTSEQKHEFFAGQIVAMAGASFNHNVISHNVGRALGNALEASTCRVCPGDIRVRTRSTLYTYPDVTVVCAQPQFDGERKDILLNPVLIVEVLSESTEAYDRGTKFEHYRSIATLQTYLLVAQDRVHVDQFEKQPSGDWLLKPLSSLDSRVEVQSLGISVPIGEFYKKVDFGPAAG
jgi:Uma2 family endonuclease